MILLRSACLTLLLGYAMIEIVGRSVTTATHLLARSATVKAVIETPFCMGVTVRAVALVTLLRSDKRVFRFPNWANLSCVSDHTISGSKALGRCSMQNHLRQPEIRQVLTPDAVAHPDRIQAGDEIEVVSIFPHGLDGDSSGWIARFLFNGTAGCCDPRNLLRPAMYEMQQGWAQVQEMVQWLPADHKTACILSILDDLEAVRFDPTMSAVFLSSLLSGYRK